MDIKLIKKLAERDKLDWKIVYAILMCESNTRDNPGSGFWSNGKLKTRFESVIYDSFIRQKKLYVKNNILPGLDRDWICKHSVKQLVLMATSFGIAQIMGWHYPEIGYDTIEDMVNDYKAGDVRQIYSFFNFINIYRSGKFLKILANASGGKNFRKIAKYYNGAGYRKNKYHIKLKTYYDNAPEQMELKKSELPSEISLEQIDAMPLYTGPGLLEKMRRKLFNNKKPAI